MAAEKVAEAKLASAINGVNSNIAQVAVRSAEVDQAKQRIRDANIVAPFAGAIQQRMVAAGTFVQIGTPLLNVVRLDVLRFRGSVPERLATQLQIGQYVRLDIESIDQPVEAKITRINPALDMASRSLTFEALVDNERGLLRPGLFAEAQVTLDPNAQAVVVAASSLVEFAGAQKVWKIVGGVAKEQLVRPGRRSDGQVEIIEGLSPGEQILVDGSIGRVAEVIAPGSSPNRETQTADQSVDTQNAGRSCKSTMYWLAELCVRRPVFALMLIAALVVAGVVAFPRLGVDRYPSMDMPTITVRTVYPGAASVEVEAEVSQVLEDAVATVAGIEELRSISSDGTSLLLITFNLNRNFDAAVQDVRDAVSGVLNRLPTTVDPPIVQKQDTDSSPVMSLAVSGPRTSSELFMLADRYVKNIIESAPGVGQVTIAGSADRAVQVNIDARRLAAHQLSILQVREALQRQNVEVRVDASMKARANDRCAPWDASLTRATFPTWSSAVAVMRLCA